MNLKFKNHPLGIIALYFIMMLIGLLIGMVLFALIGKAIYDLPFNQFITLASMTTQEIANLSDIEIKAYYFMNAYMNFFQYLLIAIAFIVYSKDYLIEDFVTTKKDNKRFWIMLIAGLIAVILMFLNSILANFIVSKLSDGSQITSSNQNIIEMMIKNGQAPIVFISVVFLAPFVEEMVFRKAIFKICDRFKPAIQILISSLIFALPHMLSGEQSITIWFVLFISYSISGALLGLIYYYSKKNIYTTMFAHMINNIVSFILVFI